MRAKKDGKKDGELKDFVPSQTWFLDDCVVFGIALVCFGPTTTACL